MKLIDVTVFINHKEPEHRLFTDVAEAHSFITDNLINSSSKLKKMKIVVKVKRERSQ